MKLSPAVLLAASLAAAAPPAPARNIRFGAPVIPPGTCALAGAAFCDDFEEGPTGTPGREGDLNPLAWSVGRYPAQDFSSPTEADPVMLAPAPPCRAGITATSVYPDQDTQICDPAGSASSQLMTVVGEQNYGVASYRIRQPFDFAGRTGKIAFDVDAVTESGLASWVSMDLTEDPVTASNFLADPALGNERGPGMRNGLSIHFNNGVCGAVNGAPDKGLFNSVGYVLLYTNYAQTIISLGAPTNNCMTTAWGVMNHIEIDVSQDHVDVYGSDASPDGGHTFPNFRKLIGADAHLTFTRGYVHVSGHNHAVEKYCHPASGFCAGGTELDAVYHWDNVGFDGPAVAAWREHEVPDPLTPTVTRGHPAVNTGYVVGDFSSAPGIYARTSTATYKVGPLVFKGVNRAGVTGARLAFNSFYLVGQAPADLTTVNLKYRLNGGPWRDRFFTPSEAASQAQPVGLDPNYPRNSGTMAQIIDVLLGDLVDGDNTLDLATVNSPQGYPTVVSSVDLVLSTQ